MFRNAYHQVQLCFYRFQDSICRKGSGNEDNGRRSASHLDCITNCIEYRHPVAHLSCLTGGRTAYDIRAVGLHLFCMETGCLAGNALYNDLRIFMN